MILVVLGRVAARAVTVVFGTINAMTGRANPAGPPPDITQKPPEYRP